VPSRNSILKSVALIVTVVLTASPTTALAHHSTTEFGSTKTATVTGIVAKFGWTNPHVYVWVNVPSATDPARLDLYAFESASPNVLEVVGWNRTVLKAGDKITVEYSPFRDGTNGGGWIVGRLANGRVLRSQGGNAVSRGKPSTPNAAQGAVKCPRAEVVEVMPKATSETRPASYRNGTIHVSRTPLSTLPDVTDIEFDTPGIIKLAFTPEVGERMERITARPDFSMAFVVDNEAVLSVVLKGGFGIGKNGLQISVDSNFDRIRMIYETLSRCVAARSKK
jgi:hypothetical protein